MHPYVLLCPLLCPICVPHASVHHQCTLCFFLCTPMSLCISYKLPIHPLCPHLCTLCTPMHHYELAMLLSYTPHAPYASPMPTICPPVHSHASIFTLCALLFTLFISHVLWYDILSRFKTNPDLRTFGHNQNSNACQCNNYVQRL